MKRRGGQGQPHLWVPTVQWEVYINDRRMKSAMLLVLLLAAVALVAPQPINQEQSSDLTGPQAMESASDDSESASSEATSDSADDSDSEDDSDSDADDSDSEDDASDLDADDSEGDDSDSEGDDSDSDADDSADVAIVAADDDSENF
ncbi:hypothetical protein UPYG_G00229420 [Umbra pygmaea]|uniref:Uncharacterized protein n=1 Tax=Umbra pygmaea TaxID=75934 RepID=A0ABD0WD44_UMBPY